MDIASAKIWLLSELAEQCCKKIVKRADNYNLRRVLSS